MNDCESRYARRVTNEGRIFSFSFSAGLRDGERNEEQGRGKTISVLDTAGVRLCEPLSH